MHDHAKRRAAILKAHPEIKALMEPDARTGLVVVFLVALQTTLAVAVAPRLPAVALVLLAYVIGAVASHALFLCVHEAAHHLVFCRPAFNRALGAVANLPALLPYAGVFRHFHLLHHSEQGVPGNDTDLPTELETWLVVDSAHSYADRCLRKAIYLSIYLGIYAVRPLVVSQSQPEVSAWVAVNWVLQIAYVWAVASSSGVWAVAYLALSTLLAGSLHPVAAHFQAEHTEQVAGIDTYSYYGPLNYVSLNVGYHNEHHDFPNVPWTRLPRIRAVAAEFYASKSQQTAWPRLMLAYVLSDALGPQARAVRGREHDVKEGKRA